MTEHTKIYWFTKEQTAELASTLQGMQDSTVAVGIIQELTVSGKRAKGTKLPVAELGHALGLKNGSVPIWLTDKEHQLVKSIIKT